MVNGSLNAEVNDLSVLIATSCILQYALYTSTLIGRLPNGAEYLFIARDEADLVGWVEAINRAIKTLEPTNPLSTSGHHGEH